MNKIYTETVVVRLRVSSRRDVEIGYTFQRRSGGYYVNLAGTGERLGWVMKLGNEWVAYCPKNIVNGCGESLTGVPIAWEDTREMSVWALLQEHAFHAGRSPIYSLAEAAYAEVPS
jgi:hypothetical protein